MSLDVVNKNDLNFNNAVQPDAVFGKWQDFPYSKISHHGRACCEIAREWLFSMDFSQLNGGSLLTGPRWIRAKYNWGPSRWEIYWCEAVREKTLDCGALAHLAHEVFKMRGVRSFPVQLVQQFNEDATSQWTNKWDDKEISTHWINKDLIYHEGCAVVTQDNEIKIFDPSAGWWLNPQQFGGYGGLLALRLFAPESQASSHFNWGEHRITPNQWQRIKVMAAAKTAA
ncbi:MAG TPA: hypothetical protein VEX64_02785 [Pyrinomonadaceae bacterium]|jgi:hypothetical protein|nr:hypothetical protein [Pyrinomonadaceae bacterium]